MANMDNVSKKILEDAKQKKQEIIEEAQAKADQIIQEAQRKKQRNLQGAAAQAEQQYQQTYDLEVLKANSDLQQQLLLAKLEAVDSTIEKAKKKLTEADKQSYLDFISRSIDSLDIKQGTFLIGRREKNLTQTDVQGLVKNIDLKPGDQEPDFDYGIKVISGNAEHLISPQSIIDSQAEDIKMEIADFLFSKEK